MRSSSSQCDDMVGRRCGHAAYPTAPAPHFPSPRDVRGGRVGGAGNASLQGEARKTVVSDPLAVLCAPISGQAQASFRIRLSPASVVGADSFRVFGPPSPHSLPNRIRISRRPQLMRGRPFGFMGFIVCPRRGFVFFWVARAPKPSGGPVAFKTPMVKTRFRFFAPGEQHQRFFFFTSNANFQIKRALSGLRGRPSAAVRGRRFPRRGLRTCNGFHLGIFLRRKSVFDFDLCYDRVPRPRKRKLKKKKKNPPFPCGNGGLLATRNQRVPKRERSWRI